MAGIAVQAASNRRGDVITNVRCPPCPLHPFCQIGLTRVVAVIASITGDREVVHSRIQEGGIAGFMARIASIARCRNMSRSFLLRTANSGQVARTTGCRRHSGMVINNAREGCKAVMAIIALQTGRDVIVGRCRIRLGQCARSSFR